MHNYHIGREKFSVKVKKKNKIECYRFQHL